MIGFALRYLHEVSQCGVVRFVHYAERRYVAPGLVERSSSSSCIHVSIQLQGFTQNIAGVQKVTGCTPERSV